MEHSQISWRDSDFHPEQQDWTRINDEPGGPEALTRIRGWLMDDPKRCAGTKTNANFVPASRCTRASENPPFINFVSHSD